MPREECLLHDRNPLSIRMCRKNRKSKVFHSQLLCNISKWTYWCSKTGITADTRENCCLLHDHTHLLSIQRFLLATVVFIVSQFCNKVIFLMSFVGNRGTFTRGYLAMIMDVEFLYHLLYLIICGLGVFVHVFFYSLLVSGVTQN